MIKFIVLLKRKAGSTPQQFRDYYENIHIPLGAKYVGHLLVNFRRHYPSQLSSFVEHEVPEGEGPYFGEGVDCAYDCISVYSLRDEFAFKEMTEILSDPEIKTILAEDEERFLDRSACRMGGCDVLAGEGVVAK